MRVVGRGGTGSRPRTVKPPESVEIKPTSPPEKPAFHRPMGRGGMGSRKKSGDQQSPPSPALLTLIRKAAKKKDVKGKSRTGGALVHPIPPNLAYEIMNGSSSTLGSLHFTGELGGPPPNFFPSSKSVRSDGSSLSPPPSATSSNFSPPPSATSQTFSDIGDDASYSDSLGPEQRQRSRNMSKLSRTLGDIPSMYDRSTLDPSARRGIPAFLVEDLDGEQAQTSKVSRRSSLISMSSLGSIFARPTPRSRARDSTASHTSMSTLPSDDLHRLDLGDALSDSWGERDSVYRSESPESPIIFSLPSPVPAADPDSNASTPSLANDSPSPTTPMTLITLVEEPEDLATSPTLEPSLSRTRSLSHDRSHSRGHSYSTSGLTDEDLKRSTSPSEAFVVTSAAMANRPDWLIPPEQDGVQEDPAFAFRGQLPVKQSPAWTGEWNTDMRDVIRALRDLR